MLRKDTKKVVSFLVAGIILGGGGRGISPEPLRKKKIFVLKSMNQ